MVQKMLQGAAKPAFLIEVVKIRIRPDFPTRLGVIVTTNNGTSMTLDGTYTHVGDIATMRPPAISGAPGLKPDGDPESVFMIEIKNWRGLGEESIITSDTADGEVKLTLPGTSWSINEIVIRIGMARRMKASSFL